MATLCGPDCPEFEPQYGRDFPAHSDWPWIPLGLLYNCCQGFVPRVKRPEREGEHPPRSSIQVDYPFNAGNKSLRATLPDEIFTWDFDFLPCISLIYAWKTNKYIHYSFSLLNMYGSSYMFRHYIAIFRDRSKSLLRDAQFRSSR
jgi:hypothetical protein